MHIALYSNDRLHIISSDLRLLYIEIKCSKHCVILEDKQFGFLLMRMAYLTLRKLIIKELF